MGRGIATDLKGNVYLTGLFTGATTFASDGENFILSSRGGTDAFVTKVISTLKSPKNSRIAKTDGAISSPAVDTVFGEMGRHQP